MALKPIDGAVLFGRYAEIKVGLPGKIGRHIKSISNDSEGNLVQGLHITFKIEKTSESSANKAQIDIYNLNPDSIEILSKKGAVIELSVGYGIIGGVEPHAAVIFKGDVVKTVTIKKGSDYVTTIENGDGLAALQNSNVNASFGPGAPVKSVVENVISTFTGLGTGEINLGEAAQSQFLNGTTLSGSSASAMDSLAAKTGTEWSVQDGLIQMIPNNAATSLPAVYLKSTDGENTGLIGSPTLSGFNHSKEKKLKGVEFKSLLRADLVPGRRVLIESHNKKVNGQFIVRKVTHNGDTRTGPWYSECEGVAP